MTKSPSSRRFRLFDSSQAKFFFRVTALTAILMPLLACGKSSKDLQNELEASRSGVLTQVRHLRTFGGVGIKVGDLIIGNYQNCEDGAVNYVARSDWISVGSKPQARIVSVLRNNLSRDGWSIDKILTSGHLMFRKGGYKVEVIEYSHESMVKVYVAGKCYKVGDLADSFVQRSTDEFDK